jgi:hypothetical protein
MNESFLQSYIKVGWDIVARRGLRVPGAIGKNSFRRLRLVAKPQAADFGSLKRLREAFPNS